MKLGKKRFWGRTSLLKKILRITKMNFGAWHEERFNPIEVDALAPLRAELLSLDQLIDYGKTLAAQHTVEPADRADRLLLRLADNSAALRDAFSRLTELETQSGSATEATQQASDTQTISVPAISPASEWFLDNFYLIEEQIITAKAHLPRGYSRELPQLASGPSTQLPRVYDIALAAISHSDGRLDMPMLQKFIEAYQSVTPLALGELWAIPIMLRLALIENLRRVATRILIDRQVLLEANHWAAQMIDTAEHDPKNLIVVIADMARANPPMVSAFVAELARRLRGHGQALTLGLNWIEQRLAESSLTIDRLVLAGNQQHAADQLSISNSIGSLRVLGAANWQEFVESLSHVEAILHADIDGTYSKMDFATRDSYRHVIDRLAKASDYSELDVARTAIKLAQAASGAPQQHVGYYLQGAGLPDLEQKITAKISWQDRLTRAVAHYPLTLHFGSALMLSLLFTGALLKHAAAHGTSGWALLALAALCLLCTSQLSLSLTNLFATLIARAKRLPRMDFAQTFGAPTSGVQSLSALGANASLAAPVISGVPLAMKTLVVVPSMLSGAADIEALLEALEVRFLGNQDAHIYFALLTDYLDANAGSLAGDAALLSLAEQGIIGLNRKYRQHEFQNGAPLGADRFFLMHRPRLWNASEGVWMGYERKRGKLSALNALLRSHGSQALNSQHSGAQHFEKIVGDLASLSKVKYIITLDTDTELPRDAARQFIGAMAHPLNQPQIDSALQRVTRGYGILQPRMSASLSGRSIYARLCSSEPGIDPYTRSVSDVYQDVFSEGSFIGKGIYDIDAFEQVLDGRFPENRILSHDLLEGCYARSGLISDVHLYEQYPASYLSDVSRQARWVRGDWQIAQWCLPRVPAPGVLQVSHKSRAWNPLSKLSRGKIFDNLRRSLVPFAQLTLVGLGVAVMSDPWFWSLAVLAMLLLPGFFGSLLSLVRWPAQVPLKQHVRSVFINSVRSLALTGFRIASLPFEAYFNMDAIVRACWRMRISHRKLLAWRTSSSTAGFEASVAKSYATMWAAPASGLLLLLLSTGDLTRISAAAFWALLWLAAPYLAWRLSLPLTEKVAHLDQNQHIFLRKIARKTWAYFERFVVAGEHHLPPDNYQLHPGPVIAHRTSPTNMGLALLANLSAHDFGFISSKALLQRTSDALSSMQRLPRYLGHFYNWYDTQSLATLAPRYISTVDSGNLAGHLLTLRSGLLEHLQLPIFGQQTLQGLQDTFSVVEDATPHMQRSRLDRLRALLSRALALQSTAMLAPRALADVLQDLVDASEALTRQIDILLEPNAGSWTEALNLQIQGASIEVDLLTPWLRMDEPDLTRENLSPENLALLQALSNAASLQDIAALSKLLAPMLSKSAQTPLLAEPNPWLARIRSAVASASIEAQARIENASALALIADQLCQMDYEFLYDHPRKLLAIGFNVDDQRRDSGYYDLLASEARLGYFMAIAFGQVPQASWFALGRLRTNLGGAPILMSWSGSMFEYLMPMLVMPSYRGTLLDESCQAAVSRQIGFGSEHGLPWGVSESGYSKLDANLNYQYHAFGVPGLGLKRGLASDLVVAPYASALALMVQPEAACENLQRFAKIGIEGNFGFFEAVDYTPARIARGQSSVVVRSFMAHHQGMSLLSIAHLLQAQPMQRRFISDARVQATLLLLQERIPKDAIFHQRLVDTTAALFSDAQMQLNSASMGAHTLSPCVQLLSNGHYQVMLSNAGSGYSRWQAGSDVDAGAPLSITRWREDASCDHWGTFFYLRDANSGEFWSATHQPTCKRADSYEAIFSEGRAEYRRRDHQIDCAMEVVVSPEDDIEVRRITLTNRASSTRTIELTSYAEIVLAPQMAEQTQPAFSNLFVQTEIVPTRRAVLCNRRPRSSGEAPAWMFHLLATNGDAITQISFETDRMRFIGRGQNLAAPAALADSTKMLAGNSLSNTQGSVLDPVAAIRCSITLLPGQSASVDFVCGAATSRESCMQLIARYQDRHHSDRVFDLAYTHASILLRQLDISEADAALYRRLAGHMLYPNSAMRAEAQVLLQNRREQSGLWGFSISGDLPIMLLKISDSNHIALAQSVISCHNYLKLKGLGFDLVILNEDHAGYRQRLQDQINALMANGTQIKGVDRSGAVFVRAGDQISNEDRILLQAVARVIIDDSQGSFAEQVSKRPAAKPRVPRLHKTQSARPAPQALEPMRTDLILSNGIGGFSADGSEYIITSRAGQLPPLPWVNVLANEQFGTVISERGLSYSWSENAREFRLTPWSDDPVGASGGEAFYLRDEQSGHVWGPAPAPVVSTDTSTYTTRHGFGYSIFEHVEDGIESELTVYVDLTEAVKFSVLKLRNKSGRTRKLSATGFVEWVLGDLKSKTGMHICTEIDASSGAIFARNHYSTEFADRIAFFDVDDAHRTLSADRAEFIGRNGSLAAPAAMSRAWLSGRVGAGLDACGAIQVPFELADGAERQIIFRLGAANSVTQARSLSVRLRVPGSARAALNRVRNYWQHTLAAVQVQTPDPAFNVLANGWLVYQSLACRYWARSGFYQSGGAFGFRDQLQDVMALVHVEPALMRTHLVRAGARQYPEGDVQHWWHPPTGRGVRTRCSDDYLWLPLACARYTGVTGDFSVFDESVPYLSGRMLSVDEESYYDLPGRSGEAGSLYQHCVRAIEHGLRFGAHGLPLMGSGDWNDGMNLVGIEGKGESVWLGFFLYHVLNEFMPICISRGDAAFAQLCEQAASLLRKNIEATGWDGAWYRRAYFDDGAPLGASENRECSIDSIAQSWSVLSGAGDKARVQSAMQALDQRLVRRDAQLVQLLDPPFDPSAHADQRGADQHGASQHPGYIAGYVPGVRENGGQYTHAAIWAAMAFAKLGDHSKAWELLNMINPINHSNSPEAMAIYKAEPYVVAADVYAVAPHVGRSGWSWYTGSAGWLYRLMLESLLGLQRVGDHLSIMPCLPASWNNYSMRYRFGTTSYQINIGRQTQPSNSLNPPNPQYRLDGVLLADEFVVLIDDGKEHVVEVGF